MRITPEISATSLVLIGAFNPRIFQPEWFARCGIIGESESKGAVLHIVHRQLTAFSLDWLNFEASADRAAFESAASPFVRLRDLVAKTFGEFLSHTPIYQLGINRVVHFNVGSFEARNEIGKLLAPQEPWGIYGAEMTGEEGKPQTYGGLRSMTMIMPRTEGPHSGALTTRLEPSLQLQGHGGIFMEVNDHYNLGTAEEIIGADAAIEVLNNNWEESITRSESIIDQVMSLRA